MAGHAEYSGTTIANELQLPIENDVLGVLLYDGRLNSAGIHPNARGYHRMAEAIADLLRRTGAI